MSVALHLGDCLEVMPSIPDNTVDTIITDPPYGLSKEPDIAEVMQAWLDDKPYEHNHKGFMGKSWDSFVPGPRYWREAYRVLKPGGTLLCFASTRTFDLMGISLRFAGFEMHPFLVWINGQGFPKATSVSKMLDRSAKVEREVMGKHPAPCSNVNATAAHGGSYQKSPDITAPATPAAQLWDGWYYGKQSLKPAVEPILMAQKPMDGTGFHNALAWGVAGLWVDGGRIGTGDDITNHSRGAESAVSKGIYGDSTAQKTHQTPGQKLGRWPANLILSHTPQCRQVGVRKVKSHNPDNKSAVVRGGQGIYGEYAPETPHIGYADPDGTETVPAWECVEDCPVAMLDEQSGELHSNSGNLKEYPGKVVSAYGQYAVKSTKGRTDSGGASRFFYQPKAPRRERWFYCPDCDDAYPMSERTDHQHGHENFKHLFSHPTQKPLGLMRYLAKLTKTPTGGTVLDMFMGTGTTGEACVLEGRPFIGIEREYPSHKISQRRIESAQNEMQQLTLEGQRA